MTTPGNDPVSRLVKGYLIERVRSLSAADPELFDRAFELYDTLESHHQRQGAGHLSSLKRHPVLEKVLGLLGPKAHGVYEAGLRVARDNEEITRRLRQRVDELGLDLSTEDGLEEATLEYERILSATVPLETSLENVGAVADAIDLGNDFMNSRNPLKRGAFQAAWTVLLPMAIRDGEVRSRVQALKDELSGDRPRLQAMSGLVRTEGPRIVREAYERGHAAPC